MPGTQQILNQRQLLEVGVKGWSKLHLGVVGISPEVSIQVQLTEESLAAQKRLQQGQAQCPEPGAYIAPPH